MEEEAWNPMEEEEGVEEVTGEGDRLKYYFLTPFYVTVCISNLFFFSYHLLGQKYSDTTLQIQTPLLSPKPFFNFPSLFAFPFQSPFFSSSPRKTSSSTPSNPSPRTS